MFLPMHSSFWELKGIYGELKCWTLCLFQIHLNVFLCNLLVTQGFLARLYFSATVFKYSLTVGGSLWNAHSLSLAVYTTEGKTVQPKPQMCLSPNLHRIMEFGGWPENHPTCSCHIWVFSWVNMMSSFPSLILSTECPFAKDEWNFWHVSSAPFNIPLEEPPPKDVSTLSWADW